MTAGRELALDIALIPSSASVARLRQSNDFIGTSVRDIYMKKTGPGSGKLPRAAGANCRSALELPKKENLRRTVQ
jgi:hypothetical protein